MQMAGEINAIHRPKVQTIYTGINPEWDGEATADLSKAMIPKEQTVCSAGCGEYPCETVKLVNSG